MTLKQKMLALYLGISILTLAVGGIWLTLRFSQSQQAALERELLNQLHHIDFALTTFLTEVQSDVLTLASHEVVRTRDDQDFTNFLTADEATFEYNIGETEQKIIAIFNDFRITHHYVNSVYMGRENGSFVRSHERASPTQYDPRTRPWYILGKDHPGEVVMTEPYPSVTTTDVNLGIVTALVDESGEVCGVVGADITLVNLSDYISGFQIGHQGEILLIDENGTILVSREKDYQFQSASVFLGDQMETLMNNEQGTLTFTNGAESSQLFFYTSPTLGWKIAVAIPSSQITGEILNIVLPLLFSFLLALALVSILTYAGLNVAIIKPLTDLNIITQDITVTGDLRKGLNVTTRDEIGSLATSFNQMIVSIQHTQDDLRKERDLANALRDAAIALTDTLDVEIILDRILEQVSRVIPNEACNVLLIEDDRTKTVRWMGYDLEREDYIANAVFSVEETPTFARMVTEKEPIFIPDTQDMPGWRNIPEISWLRSYAAAPIIVRNQVIGFLNLDSATPNFFQESQQNSLKAFASYAGAAIENARLYGQIKEQTRDLEARVATATKEISQRVDELVFLNKIGQEITSTLDLDAMLQTIANKAAELVVSDRSIILLIDEKKEALIKSVGAGYTKEQIESHTFEEFQQGISGWVLIEKTPTLSADLKSDSRNRGVALAHAQESLANSAAIAPLLVGEQIIGTLTVVNTADKPPFTQSDLELVTRLANLAAVAIHNAQLYEGAQEADRLKSAFLASMSHELRTPLNSIIGFTGILLQGLVGPLNAEQNKQLGMVQSSARHLLTLINDVLDISKIEAGQLQIEIAEMDVRESIQTVVKTVQPLADKKGIPILVDIGPGVGVLNSDQRRVEQVLINLINNAIKFTDEGEVRVASHLHNDVIITRVSDTGIGIKPEDQQKLFRTFQQIDTGLARKHEGTGLGLSISKKLVEMLGGTIWVESEWELGSTFSFKLPLIPPKAG